MRVSSFTQERHLYKERQLPSLSSAHMLWFVTLSAAYDVASVSPDVIDLKLVCFEMVSQLTLYYLQVKQPIQQRQRQSLLTKYDNKVN